MNLLFIIAKGKQATKKIRIPVVINEDKSQLINITDNAVQKKRLRREMPARLMVPYHNTDKVRRH